MVKCHFFEVPLSVKFILREKEYDLEPDITVQQALLQIDIAPESVLPTRNGELITEDEFLRDGDVIKLVAVISGGVLMLLNN